MATPAHVPVLLDRVVALLAPSLQDHGAVMVFSAFTSLALATALLVITHLGQQG